MNVTDDINRAFLDGFNECLNTLETAILHASWYDNMDEDIAWELVQELRKNCEHMIMAYNINYVKT